MLRPALMALGFVTAAAFTPAAASINEDTPGLIEAMDACTAEECAALDTLLDGAADSDTRDLLAAWSNWTERPNRSSRQRKLDRELADLVDTDPTPITTRIFRSRYEFDFARGDYGRAYETAGEAADHFKPATGIAPSEAWARARMAELTADVARGNLRRPRLLMAHHAGMLWRDRELSRDEAGNTPDWVMPLFWEAVAWTQAIDVYGESEGERSLASDEDVAAIFASYDLSEDGRPSFIALPRDVPFCQGAIANEGVVEYPDLAVIRERVGVVLVAFDLDAGQPTSPRILATVPNNVFDQAVLDAVPQWEWTPDADATNGACHLDAVGLVQMVSFGLGDRLER